jgi:PPM family protein phosphatase
MAAAAHWRAGAASDRGRARDSNQDRYWLDDERGVFLVVDGVGGHAGGETAAETAVQTIRQELLQADDGAEERVRRAIALANNQIYQMARDAEALRGMACVLTLALVEDGDLVIGHVGDSRLYLIWNGAIRKLTSDHSPVGEGEDSGELTEQQAMTHPRRHEVFRDVGTRLHTAGDDGFIEIRRCRFKQDAAFLLCSDGLSDRLTSGEIREIMERYEDDAAQAARELVKAANEAGGQDNITALVVAGREFHGRASAERHSTTRARLGGDPRSPARFLTGRIAFLFYGALLGILMWVMLHPVRG